MQKKIIIFGAGYHGRNALRVSETKRNYRVICFADNDKKIHGKKILGKKIINPKKINKYKFDKIILCGRYIPSIINQLNEMKIKKSTFLLWGKKELKIKNKYFKLRSNECIKGLKDIIQIFKISNLKFWIDMGSLLALIRKQDLATTSDIDIIIDHKNLKKINFIKKNITKNFNNYDFEKKGFYNSKLLRKKIPKYIITKKNRNLNFEPIVFEINIFVNKFKMTENLAKKKILKKLYWNETEFYNYKKTFIPIPQSSKSYLKELYGKDWKVKKNFFNKF